MRWSILKKLGNGFDGPNNVKTIANGEQQQRKQKKKWEQQTPGHFVNVSETEWVIIYNFVVVVYVVVVFYFFFFFRFFFLSAEYRGYPRDGIERTEQIQNIN